MWNRLGALIVCTSLLAGCGEARKVAFDPGVPRSAAAKADVASPAFPGVANLDPPDDVGHAETQPDGLNTETYDHVVDNHFLKVLDHPLSTFSIDVDTAAYSNMRRYLTQGQLPPPGAVRIEELLNYFHYDYPNPIDGVPFSTNVEIADCPWNARHRLVRIGLKGYELPPSERPASNLVFLIDVSGSMQAANKLPLVQAGLKLLVDQLSENDRVALVVYAGGPGLVLDSTTAEQKQVLRNAIDQLQAGGSTNGAGGIELAYRIAREHFIPKGTNRVILCTDGDFNVGLTDQSQLVRLIEEKARTGVFLSVLGFGMGNYKDSTLEKLADQGNGNYAYIDTLHEARKVLVEQMQGTLITIAKDVKIQIEFNPAQAAAYRLIGYENRLLAKEDFNDDQKDAGEIGAGHTVTALYEVIPPGHGTPTGLVDPLKYQAPVAAVTATTTPDSATQAPDAAVSKQGDSKTSDELLTLKLRYKQPDGMTSQLIEVAVKDVGKTFSKASPDFAWAAAVASFGMILRDSSYQGNATLAAVLEIAQANRGDDPAGYRAEFIRMVQMAIPLKSARQASAR